ncbi:MAG: ShlB/FhaC/HecB family hemolysin secretion/activation protein [Candidatus Melainabacteria bacterium]
MQLWSSGHPWRVWRPCSWALALLLPLLCVNGSAAAQEIPLPSDSAPGLIIQHDTQPWALPGTGPGAETQPGNAAPSPEVERTLPEVELEPEVPEAPRPPAAVSVRDIVLDQCPLLSKRRAGRLIAGYRDRTLTFEQVQALADALSDLYVSDGYLNSQVYVPMQTLTDGVLTLRCQETRIGGIILEDARWFGRRAVMPRLGQASGDVFNIKPWVRSLRHINENPDLKLRLVLRAGDEAGTSDLVLKPETRFPVHVTPYWDNLGRENIGNFRLGATVVHNNLLGFGDTLSTSYHQTTRSNGISAQYGLPVGPYGTQLGLTYAYSHIRLSGDLAPLKIRSEAQIFSPTLHQPLYHSRRAEVSVDLALDFKNLKTHLLDEPFHRDRIRDLRTSVQATLFDAWGRTAVDQELAIGLPWMDGTLGDSVLASKTGSGTRFIRFSGGLTRVNRLPLGMVGVVRGRYQFSPDRLVSAEQFQSGGAFSTRGYNEGQVIGDSGYAASAEVYMPTPLMPPGWRLPKQTTPLRQALQWTAFADVSQVATNQPEAGESRNETLLGVGFGIRLALSRFVVGRLDVGFPLLKPWPLESRPRLHLGLQSTLF